MQAPAIRKITLNMGVGDAKQDSKVLEAATEQLATIAGQRPSVRRARKSIAAFKLREGMPVGVSVTLRGERSYEFLDRLMSVAIPRIRDFRGMNPRSFDGRGNYSMGVREQIIFPEIDYDAIDQTRGLDITITTSAAHRRRGVRAARGVRLPVRTSDEAAPPRAAAAAGRCDGGGEATQAAERELRGGRGCGRGRAGGRGRGRGGAAADVEVTEEAAEEARRRGVAVEEEPAAEAAVEEEPVAEEVVEEEPAAEAVARSLRSRSRRGGGGRVGVEEPAAEEEPAVEVGVRRRGAGGRGGACGRGGRRGAGAVERGARRGGGRRGGRRASRDAAAERPSAPSANPPSAAATEPAGRRAGCRAGADEPKIRSNTWRRPHNASARRVRQSSRPARYSRCHRCGRARSVYRKFGLCRICLREMAHQGQIPGMTKSSW